MYSYKLNNSYTVYVNHVYLNDCIRASKEWSKHYPSTEPKAIKKTKAPFKPLARNTWLKHKTFGFGKVISTTKSGIMQVAFENKIVKFVYPDAVKQGFLALA